MNQIIIPVSNDPVTFQKRKLHFTGLQIKPDLNMLLTADVVYYADDGVTKLVNYIENDNTLTLSQKRQQVNKFKDQAVKADTSSSWVDAITGEPVELIPVHDENNVLINNTPPEGSIEEIVFWQNIPLSVFLEGSGLPEQLLTVLSQVKFSDLFYGAIQKGMINMDLRKGF